MCDSFSFKTSNSFRNPYNVTPKEFGPILKLSKNKNAFIHKSGNGNSAVLVDKIVYNNGVKIF